MQRWILDKLIELSRRIHVNSAAAKKQLQEYRYFMDLREREDDIYISTFLKSGTTWMQMIVYQLTTTGVMDFNHIYDVSPWLRNAATKGETPPNDLPSPRIFKSHDPYHNFNKNVKGRFIFVFRNPSDVAVSLYHHLKNYSEPEISLEETLERYFTDTLEYNFYSYHRSWFLNLKQFPILYIKYENLKSNLENEIKKISDFIGVELTDEVMNRVKVRSGFEFMKQHQEKFGEQPTLRDKRIYDQFIRKGQTGEGDEILLPEQLNTIKRGFQEHLKEFQPLFFN